MFWFFISKLLSVNCAVIVVKYINNINEQITRLEPNKENISKIIFEQFYEPYLNQYTNDTSKIIYQEYLSEFDALFDINNKNQESIKCINKNIENSIDCN